MKPLRALLVEDCEDDARMLVRDLRVGGYDLTFTRVETRDDMRACLTGQPWDVVLSDYSLPTFSGPEALALMQELSCDLPFIIISGTIGEETAVQALKAGAHDFFVKGRLARLVPAIERELREAVSRRERRAAEQALRQSELKYRQIVETTQEGVWTLDAKLVTTYANARMAEMLNVPQIDLIGAPLSDFLDGDTKEATLGQFARITEGGAQRRDFKFRRRGTGEMLAALSTTPIVDETGGYAGSLSMVSDVTEQRALQAQLMVSDRMASVGTMAAGVAHEINNPLAAVIANLDLAIIGVTALASEEQPRAIKELQECLTEAREAANRVRQIVQDIKIFSRAEDEKRGPVDVERVLESSLRMARSEIRHRARLVREGERVPPVQGNESRLGQVFLNLIVNAAQAIPEGHIDENEIRIKTGRVTSGQIFVDVSDTGGGMPPEVTSQLFRPFFTTKAAGVGTGLGLSICHRIVTGLGGSIEATSVVGKGTTFRVILPRARRDTTEMTPAAQPAAAVRRGRVLVVDDEPMIADVVRRTLAPLHEVTICTGGRETLELLATGAIFDAIVCDLMMPTMTGMELHAELTRRAPAQAERMIFVSGAAFSPEAQAFLGRVPNDRLDKPFDPASLRALVGRRVAASG